MSNQSQRVDAVRMHVEPVSSVVAPTPPNVASAFPPSSIVVNGMAQAAIQVMGSGAAGLKATVWIYVYSQGYEAATLIMPRFIAQLEVETGPLVGVSGLHPNATQRWVDDAQLVAGTARIRSAPGGMPATIYVPTDGAERIEVVIEPGTLTEAGFTLQLISEPWRAE